LAIAPALGRAACRFALDDEDLASRRISLLAVGEFAGQAAGIHRGLAARQLASFTSGFAGPRSVNALANDAARHGRVFIEIFTQALVDELLDRALDVAIEFPFCLAFKLRLRKFHGYHRAQA